MSHYDWPGNVRELHNFLDRYAIFGQSAVELLGTAEIRMPAIREGQSLADAISTLEQSIILKTLEKCRWHRGQTAMALGLNLRTLQRKMKSLGIPQKAKPKYLTS